LLLRKSHGNIKKSTLIQESPLYYVNQLSILYIINPDDWILPIGARQIASYPTKKLLLFSFFLIFPKIIDFPQQSSLAGSDAKSRSLISTLVITYYYSIK